MFNKLLIANRGEIACRVIRPPAAWACAPSPSIPRPTPMRHVRLADEAVCIGPAAARESVPGGDKIIDAAKRPVPQAIHPGYGFLVRERRLRRGCATES